MRKRFLFPSLIALCLATAALLSPPPAAAICTCDCQGCDENTCVGNGSHEQCVDNTPFIPCFTGGCEPGCICAVE